MASRTRSFNRKENIFIFKLITGLAALIMGLAGFGSCLAGSNSSAVSSHGLMYGPGPVDYSITLLGKVGDSNSLLAGIGVVASNSIELAPAVTTSSNGSYSITIDYETIFLGQAWGETTNTTNFATNIVLVCNAAGGAFPEVSTNISISPAEISNWFSIALSGSNYFTNIDFNLSSN